MRVTIAISDTPKASETFIRGHIEAFQADVIGPYVDGRNPVVGDWQPEVFSLGCERPRLRWPMGSARKIIRRLGGGRAPRWPKTMEPVWERHIAVRRPDVVLAEFGPVAMCVMDWCERDRLPLVTHFHGYDASSLLRQRAYRALLPKLFKLSAVVVAVSIFMKQQLAAIGCPPDKIHVIPCGARVREFSLSTHVDCQPCHFLWVARLVEVKGPVFTLEAFALCQAEVPECSLTMIGGGEMYDMVCAWIRRRGLGGKIRLLGTQPHSVVREYMQQCSAFVQHSHATKTGAIEGWSISTAEAAAAGLPIVATRHGGIPDQVIDAETGFLVEERDWRAMGERMIRLAKDPGLRRRIGSAARRHIMQVGNFDLQIAKLRELLQAVAASHRGIQGDDVTQSIRRGIEVMTPKGLRGTLLRMDDIRGSQPSALLGPTLPPTSRDGGPLSLSL